MGARLAIDPLLLERIYEAAALPELLPSVLQDVADGAGAVGAVFLQRRGPVAAGLASTRAEPIVAEYLAEGWGEDAGYAAPLLAEHYPGFRAETAYRTVEEIERLAVHVEFLAPRGLVAGAGTVLQGTGDHALQLTFEGFPSHESAEAALPWLDRLRASLGRAFSLTAQLHAARAASAVETLDLAGAAAAIVSGDGRLRAANDRFTDRLGDRIIERAGGLRFADPFLQAQFAEALAMANADAGVRSIAVRANEQRPAVALHVLPLRRRSRDVFGWDGVLLLLAEPANASVPGADLLRLLFDLTPAEARLARHLVEGRAPAEAAALMGIAESTSRVHLRHIFAKTGVHRQAELVRLLLGLGAPD